MKAFQVLPPNKIIFPLIDPKKIQFTFFSLNMIQPKLIRLPHQKLLAQILKQNFNKQTNQTCRLIPVKIDVTPLNNIFKRNDGQKLKLRNEIIKFQIHEKYGIIKNHIPVKISIKQNGQHKIELKRNQMIQDQFL